VINPSDGATIDNIIVVAYYYNQSNKSWSLCRNYFFQLVQRKDTPEGVCVDG